MKKYGFIGSHGCGKSSACSYLAAHLKKSDPSKSIVVIHENIREIARLTNNQINNESFQKLAFVDHLTKEFTNELLYDIVICDRTCLDTLIYGLVYKIKLPSEYFSLALNHLNTFDKVIFIRPDKENAFIANDNFRDTDIQVRNEVDKEFEKILALWGGKYQEFRTKEIFNMNYLEKM